MVPSSFLSICSVSPQLQVKYLPWESERCGGRNRDGKPLSLEWMCQREGGGGGFRCEKTPSPSPGQREWLPAGDLGHRASCKYIGRREGAERVSEVDFQGHGGWAAVEQSPNLFLSLLLFQRLSPITTCSRLLSAQPFKCSLSSDTILDYKKQEWTHGPAFISFLIAWMCGILHREQLLSRFG